MIKQEKTMWIARTKGFPSQICVFTDKPFWSTKDGWTCGKDCDGFEIGRIGTLYDSDGKLYPELTEDEPLEVNLVQAQKYFVSKHGRILTECATKEEAENYAKDIDGDIEIENI